MQDLYRIISGNTICRLSGLTLIVRPFSVIDKYMAELYAEGEYRKAFEQNCYTLEEAYELAEWTTELENELVSIPDKVENIKADYYKRFWYISDRKHLKLTLESLTTKYTDLLHIKNKFFDKTCDYIRNQAVKVYLFEKSTYLNNELFNFHNINILKLISEYDNQVLDETELRELSKHHKWKILWSSIKDPSRIFNNRPSDYTDEQLGLILWSRTYDSVYESTDTPEEAIINDNIALDGWFICQRRKREIDQKKRTAEEKAGNAGEVFMMSRNKEDTKSILSLNDGKAHQKLQMLKSDLSKHGSIDVQKLSSVKQEIMHAK